MQLCGKVEGRITINDMVSSRSVDLLLKRGTVLYGSEFKKEAGGGKSINNSASDD